MSTAKKAAKAAMIIMAATLLSKILGFGRETLLASRFGASLETDAFLVAIMLPTVLFVSVANALNTAIIPVFTEYRVKGQGDEAKRVAGALFTVVGGMGLLISIIGVLFAPVIVHLIAPKFSKEAYELTVNLTRVVFPMTVFVGLASLLAGILQSHERFTMPAVGAIPNNLIIMFYLIFFSGAFGIKGLAVAFLLGMAGQFFIQLPAFLKMDYRFYFNPRVNLPGVRKIGRLFFPIIFSNAAAQINFFVDRILASGLIVGSISALNFASKLNGFAFAIFSMAITTVIFPTLSKYSAQDDPERFKNVLSLGLRLTAYILMPIMMGMIVLRQPIVSVLFERGAFDAKATSMTAVALLFFSLGILTLGLKDVLNRAFYSLHDTKTPMINGFIAIGINIVSNLILVNYMSGNETVMFGVTLNEVAHGGLALGTSFASISSFIFLTLQLRKRIGGFGDPLFLKSMAKMSLAAVLMGIICSLAYNYITPEFASLAGKTRALALFALIAMGAFVYIGSTWLLRAREFIYLWELVIKKLFLKKMV